MAEKRKDAPEADPVSSTEAQPVQSAEPAASSPKRLKSAPEPQAVKRQVEYYLSDENLKNDQFFHGEIAKNQDGWLTLNLLLSCNKMKAMGATAEDVLAALAESKLEVREDKLAVRRPGNLTLPTLEEKAQPFRKKTSIHAHDGGIIAIFRTIPAEQSWMQLKEKLREKLPSNVGIWFASEVSEGTSFVAVAPFENDAAFFESLSIDLGGQVLVCEVAQGDALGECVKKLPRYVKEKREKEARKRQKERQRPIMIGNMKFVNVATLRGRVKEIINSRGDDEQLKPGSTDYKIIQSLLDFHPTGKTKAQGMVGIKVNQSPQGGNRCFFMIKDDGREDDFSAKKCLDAIELNPPYASMDVEDRKIDKESKKLSEVTSQEGEVKSLTETGVESERIQEVNVGSCSEAASVPSSEPAPAS
jgi:hypothetical protein